MSYVAYLLWPDTVRDFRIVTTTKGKCQRDSSLCSLLLSSVGNVTEIPSTYQGTVHFIVIKCCVFYVYTTVYASCQ